MTPPCPNCGTVYFEGPVDDAGWRSVSIASSVIFEDKLDGSQPFWGHEFFCQKCQTRWRVPAGSPHDAVDPLEPHPFSDDSDTTLDEEPPCCS